MPNSSRAVSRPVNGFLRTGERSSTSGESACIHGSSSRVRHAVLKGCSLIAHCQPPLGGWTAPARVESTGRGVLWVRCDHRSMRIEITREIESFAADAESYLAEQVERNVPATVLAHLRRGRFGAIEPLFACCHDESGQLCAVAMRTPPWPMLASGFDAETASLLIERWLAEDPLLPGISAQPPS